MRTLIALNGLIRNDAVCKRIARHCDRILCADGGGNHLRRLGIVPDLLVGDMDSIDAEALAWMEERGAAIRRVPAVKDFTDSEMAVDAVLDEEPLPDEVWMIGALGDRLDHVLANIGLGDRLARRGVRVWMTDGAGYVLPVCGSDTMELDIGELGIDRPAMSLVAVETMTGITLSGFRYPLNEAVLEPGSTLGVSNEPRMRTGKVSIRFAAGRGVVTFFSSD